MTLMLRRYATMAQSSLSGAAFGGMLLPGTPLRMMLERALVGLAPRAQRCVRSGPSWPFASGPWQSAQRAANNALPMRMAASSDLERVALLGARGRGALAEQQPQRR